jgi:CyaY protein
VTVRPPRCPPDIFPRAIRQAPRHVSAVESISEKAYAARAFPELAALVEAFDVFTDELFAELGGDVLTIEFPDQTRYVINSHLAARQIWLAAERNAWHFDPVEQGGWLVRRTGAELWATVEQLLTQKLGRPVTFQKPLAK